MRRTIVRTSFTLVTLWITCLAARAQTVVDLSRIPAGLRHFEQRPGEQPLHCQVTPLKPGLDFSFRFQSVFFVRVPMSQYFGSGHRWTMLIRVTPEGSQPVYLMNVINLPEIPRTRIAGDVGGGFLVGEGRYNVDWLMADDSGRVCRKMWTIDARLSRTERKIRVSMAPHSVSGFTWSVSSAARPNPDDAPPLRLTVLLHAAPLSPRRTTLRSGDGMVLVGLLSSLLDRLPARSVRLVVFNLEQRKELLRQDSFAPIGLDKVAQAINDMQLGVVDYRVLQNRRGHVDFLANLMNRELEAKDPSDVVLFLGPAARYWDNLPPDALRKSAGGSPRFFYLQYRPYYRRTSTFSDIITNALRKLRGKTLVIHSPGEFARAIEQVEQVRRP